MICYLDTSALAKLVVAEGESVALARWLGAHEAAAVTNWVGLTELLRVARRYSVQHEERARDILDALVILDLSFDMARVAALVPPATLRTLDAFHLASAMAIDGLDSFVTYDQRQSAAANEAGLATASPGA